MPAAALVELAEWEVFVRRGREVMDVDGLPVHERPPSHRVTVGRDAFIGPPARHRAVRGHDFQDVTLDQSEGHVLRLAETRSVLGHGIEDGLDVRR